MSQGPIFSVVTCPTALTGMAGLQGALLMGHTFAVRAQLRAARPGNGTGGTAETSVSNLRFLGKKMQTKGL